MLPSRLGDAKIAMAPRVRSRAACWDVKKTGRSMCNIHITRPQSLRASRRLSAADTLDDALLREIAGKGGDQALSGARVLINEGDSSDSLYILLSGRVKVYSTNAGRQGGRHHHPRRRRVRRRAVARRRHAQRLGDDARADDLLGRSGSEPARIHRRPSRISRRTSSGSSSARCARRPRASRAWPSRTSTRASSGSSPTCRIRPRRAAPRARAAAQQGIAAASARRAKWSAGSSRTSTAGGYIAQDNGRIVVVEKLPAAW